MAIPLSAQTLSTGSGQAYPVKPIRIICASPGASGDFSARLIAQGLTTNLGQQMIVDNRGGYASIDAVTKAAPDGYTFLVCERFLNEGLEVGSGPPEQLATVMRIETARFAKLIRDAGIRAR